MKGKRYTTEDKVRILREADRGERKIQEICREENISEVTFHRWKKQYGHMEVNEARRIAGQRRWPWWLRACVRVEQPVASCVWRVQR